MDLQLSEGVWVSIFLSACSGAIAIVLMLLVFSFVRIYRLRNSTPGMGYSLLHGVTVGMTPADLRALPVRLGFEIFVTNIAESEGVG